MLRLKDDSISFANLQPQILFALTVANDVYDQFGIDCVVTSANDGIHSTTSLHYSGAAVDLRIRNFDSRDDAQEAAFIISDALNQHYDVLLESDHIHIEYQPRMTG